MKSIFSGRFTEPTPPFFKKVRTWGLVLAATGASLMASPVVLPALVIKIAGYLTVADTVMSEVSQAAVNEEPKE